MSITKGYLDAHSKREMISDSRPGSARGKSTVIDSLLDPDSVKEHIVPTIEKLNDEIVTLLTAGNDTTSNAMIFGVYQICANPGVHQKLSEELEDRFPILQEAVTYERSKTLPYLLSILSSSCKHDEVNNPDPQTATIKEILRLGSPLPGRLPRKVPSSGFRLYEHHLPPGVRSIIHLSMTLLSSTTLTFVGNPGQPAHVALSAQPTSRRLGKCH